MGALDSFYEGAMAPPLSVNGRLIPTPNILSPAQIYAGMYPSTPTPQMSSIGPGPGPSGGYSFLQDMIDASTPSPRYIPGPSGTTVANKSGVRLPSTPASLDPMEAYAGVPKTAAQQAIDIVVHGGVPLPRARPAQAPSIPQPSIPWALPWDIGINAAMPWETAQTGAGEVPAPGGDPWGRLRANGYVTTPNRPGMITGSRPAAMPQSRSVAAPPAAVVRPIVQVAPTPFAPDSPGGQFEKQNGQGSATKSMQTSSRWQTGY